MQRFAANGGDWNLDLGMGNWSAATTSLAGPSLRASRVISLSSSGISSLRYDLAEAAFVTISLFGSDGQRLGVLENRPRQAGAHVLVWNGNDLGGRGAGVPWLRLQAGAGEVSLRAPLLPSR